MAEPARAYDPADPANYGATYAPAGATTEPLYRPPEATTAADAAKEKPAGGFVGAVLRGTGELAASLGKTGEDVGLPTTPMKEWGEKLAAEQKKLFHDNAVRFYELGT